MTVVHLIFSFLLLLLDLFFFVVSSIPSVRSSFIFLVLSLYTKLLKALQRAVELFILEGCTRYKRAKAAAAQNHRPSGPSPLNGKKKNTNNTTTERERGGHRQ